MVWGARRPEKSKMSAPAPPLVVTAGRGATVTLTVPVTGEGMCPSVTA